MRNPLQIAPPTPRVALLAGASGLVGREIAALLLADEHWATVHSLVRKPSPEARTKLIEHVVRFDALGSLPACDDVFIALGTTIKVAGSQRAFRAVDHDAVLAVAKAALAAGASRIALVSAMGASASSKVFYSKTKGEMESGIARLAFEQVLFARPSFLAGDRSQLAQAPRAGEQIALRAMRWLRPLTPSNYRAVGAADVARFMVEHAVHGGKGVQIALSGQLQA